ncbi:MmgE/PrpD family protein [Leuconostoc rapi]|uniref:MmgE/PrpD family protein n=1 Tax=Leuconostoc rapi TaxID=1406906 RepID=UPI001957D167|nr:MmgE/PrpD family protein [Leuconostoc rapi]MBM7434842.1 2-methylcitrate dehydratase PrpD [Leuconostoc rapi]
MLKTTDIASWALSQRPTGNKKIYNLAKMALLDYIAVVSLGQKEPAYHSLKQAFTSTDSGTKALKLGFAAHLLDLDDMQDDLRGHPGAVIFSSIFALNDSVTIDEVLDAYVIGLEIAARIGDLVNPNLYETGHHASSHLGQIGAAVALSYLRHDNEVMMAKVIGLAITAAQGALFQFGSDVKSFHIGLSARAAIDAIMFTKTDLTGQLNGLFVEKSIIDQYHALDTIELENWFQAFGKSWKIEKLWFKQYPFCSAAYRAVDALLTIKRNHHLTRDDVVGMTVSFGIGRDAALRYKRPKTGIEGRFSIEYILWQTLNDMSPLSRSPYQLEVLSQPPRDFITRVYETQKATNLSSEVSLTLTNGQQLSARIFDPVGSPKNPLVLTQVLEKLVLSFSKTQVQHMLDDLQQNNWHDLKQFVVI